MKAFHLLGAAPLYTKSFVLISDAGHAVVSDPAAEVQEYDKIFKENNATLTTILCTHGHYDHVGSAGVLSREWKARIYCEPADCRGSQLFPLKSADSGYQEGEKLTVDELTFTVWHTPGHTEGGVVLLCGNYLSLADPLFHGSIGRTCASWRACPFPKRPSCCPATGIFPPLARNWRTISISAAPCAAGMRTFKDKERKT